MLKIRMTRGGTKKRPYYSIVVADSHSPRDGRFIEKVGAYNPLLAKDDPNRVVFKSERIKEWLGKGAQPSDRVARFLSGEGIVKWEHGNNPQKAQPRKKAQERAAERAEREESKKAAEEEAAAAPAEEAPAEEAPAEEAAAPAEEAAPAEAAAEETPAEAAAEEAPAEEAPAEEAAPAEEPAAEGDEADKKD